MMAGKKKKRKARKKLKALKADWQQSIYHEKDLQDLLDAHEQERKKLKKKLKKARKRCKLDLERYRAAKDAYKKRYAPGSRSDTPKSSEPAEEPAQPDNLKRISGIGPKIEQLLQVHGVMTYRQLSRQSVQTLRSFLAEASPSMRMHDPSTWPLQAKLADQQAWSELARYQKGLR